MSFWNKKKPVERLAEFAPTNASVKWETRDAVNTGAFFRSDTGQKFIEKCRHEIHVMAIRACKDKATTAHSCGEVAGANALLWRQVMEYAISRDTSASVSNTVAEDKQEASSVAERRAF